ncbi:glycoside hydrolase family 16 protein [Nocardioides marmoriginsengisoli]|uniref:Glycoside hydrolase family 16 protein n=1 Tax=Nocardioides marmoriginsengisoli TaxID=661483 RepID=A0A3N0CCT6_9ACTN|nr:glycoside hydrolase family 16 protein [Nocardioides marmoriginsengisoli]RNL61262.1 glycoside hydrolase family 16 protein [Nocardioides marmoriginsengisoli]
MFRVFLIVVTVSITLVVTGWGSDLLQSTSPGNQLVNGDKAPARKFLARPAVRVLSAPEKLILGETSAVDVQAEAPAAPGDRIQLMTTGAAGLGYVRISQGVLDEDLRATLKVTSRDYTGSFRYWGRIPATGRYLQGESATFTIGFERLKPPVDPPAATCGGAAPLKADGSPWTCTYDDEFEGTALDRRYWVPHTGGSTSGTRSMFACAMDSPDTIAVADGNLELSLVELPAPRDCTRTKSSKFAYGQVMHYETFAQTYGKYEVRAKLPDIRVPGVQQSFWLWPKKNTYGPWPMSGEIDFAEIYSSRPNLDRPYIHYLPGEKAKGSNLNVRTANCEINPGEYNTYGVEWEPRRITVLLNGEVCFINDYRSAAAAVHGPNSPFDKPFYFLMNQAMGTVGNVYDPAVVPDKVTTKVDYVRIWK